MTSNEERRQITPLRRVEDLRRPEFRALIEAETDPKQLGILRFLNAINNSVYLVQLDIALLSQRIAALTEQKG